MAGPLFNLGTFLRQLEETSVDVEDLYHNINSTPLVTEKPDAKEFEYKEGKIKFENLGFKHVSFDENILKKKPKKKSENKNLFQKVGGILKRGEKQEEAVPSPETKTEMEKIKVEEKMLLKGFSLEIEPGTTNAIVGSSGFGKTTLFNLLYRIYAQEEGRILIDGQDTADLKFESFRKHIAMVPQNGVLFNDTILYNL